MYLEANITPQREKGKSYPQDIVLFVDIFHKSFKIYTSCVHFSQDVARNALRRTQAVKKRQLPSGYRLADMQPVTTLQDKAVDDFRHAGMIVVGTCNIVRCFFHFRMSVYHGGADTGRADHWNIVSFVTHSHGVLYRY